MTKDAKIEIPETQDAILARQSTKYIKRYVFPAGTVLFQKGEMRQCAFLIDKGKIKIVGNDEGGEDKLLCVLGEEEIFGELALIDNSPRTATAITETDAEVFVIPRDALNERTKGLDPIVSLLISLLVERYRVTRIHLPESVKQGSLDDFIRKVYKKGQIPDAVLRFSDSAEQREIARKELQLEQELRAALEERQFVPVLQPIFSLPSRKLAGFEALIRWNHPEKGTVFPDDFIPIAERTGLVKHLDRLMLEKVCELLPQINKIAARDLFVSVNFSGINFGTYNIVRVVENIIKKAEINPKQIKIEITESALIGDPEQAQDVLAAFQEIGMSVALDDFGTGYSSLGYLHQFAIDDLKIDRSFVAQIHDSDRSVDIVKAIIGLAKNFDLNVVAEGIEREEDIKILNILGCDMAQGYFFAKPLAVEDAMAFIKKSN
jgi:EAL domain-containing protein (putative c-di-GMP-specific phosphodiesterase class I)